VFLGDLPQAPALAAFAMDGITIGDQRIAPDVPAFPAGTPHAGAHPLDD